MPYSILVMFLDIYAYEAKHKSVIEYLLLVNFAQNDSDRKIKRFWIWLLRKIWETAQRKLNNVDICWKAHYSSTKMFEWNSQWIRLGNRGTRSVGSLQPFRSSLMREASAEAKRGKCKGVNGEILTHLYISYGARATPNIHIS